MDARELRIGNLAHTTLTHRQKQVVQPLSVVVDEIKGSKVAVTYLTGRLRTINTTHLNYSELDPIPLTPEILEKAGFEHVFEGTDIFKKGTIELHGYIPYNENDWAFNWGDVLNKEKHGQISVGYLHQLQNLYYSLTGTELEINL